MKRTIFFLILLSSFECLADFPKPWQFGMQEAASDLMEELTWFHDFLLHIITGICLFVLALMSYTIYRFNAKRNPVPASFTHNITIEIIWTLIPLMILVVIAMPSFRILKFAEQAPPAEMTVKVVGSQWYWTYSYPDHDGIEFDSNMIQEKDLKPGQKRLLEVDNRLVVPENTVIKFLITGADVIHSFAIPALGIKIDAVPGVVNQTWTKVRHTGVFYGQCSEICGIKHGFMPIALEVVTKEEFANWVESKKEQHASNNLQQKALVARAN